MARVSLPEFIGTNRDELIRRSAEKVARQAPPIEASAVSRGVPLFLDQLVQELREGSSQTNEIRKGATEHGHNLFLKGFTVSQVVHDYGAVCQAVTDLAVERNAPIVTEDFRTMNRCLDDAIASAVTEHARGQGAADAGRPGELHNLADSAITAFEVLRTGRVGVSGSTGDVLHRNLMAIRIFADRLSSDIAQPAKVAQPQPL